MSLPEDFIFSQSSLQDYVECPSRFELKYIRRQRYPAPEVDEILEYERHTERGELFHHLIHQHTIGIPADTLLKRLDDTEVRGWFETYLKNGLDGLPAVRRPELTLTVPLGDYSLMAQFDLVAFDPDTGRAVIVDWKTGGYVPPRFILEKRLQTIVYRYVLAVGGARLNGGRPISPDQIEMVYWYAQKDGETVRFPYSDDQFAEDAAALLGWVHEIDTRDEFPLTPDIRKCKFCVYRSLHNRGVEAGALAEWDVETVGTDADIDWAVDVEQVAEIEF